MTNEKSAMNRYKKDYLPYEDEMIVAAIVSFTERSKPISEAFRHLSEKLEGRTQKALSWRWHNNLSQVSETALKVEQARIKANRGKNKRTPQEQKQMHYQINQAKTVTLPFRVCEEMDGIVERSGKDSLYNMMELSTNPILSEYLSNPKNTQLYFKALETGWKSDITNEDRIVMRLENARRKTNEYNQGYTAGILFTLEQLGKLDILKAKQLNLNVGE